MGFLRRIGSSELNVSSVLVDAWYQQAAWLGVFRPLSLLFQVLAKKRREDYLSGKKKSAELSVPVVVVGNITAGGTGKTPLVIAIVAFLRQQGFRPGVVSRGYSSKAPHYPFIVSANSNPDQAGDEPLLIARRSGCPVIIDPDRVLAAQKLIDDYACDVIISDDGLQHYRLGRDIEICIIDGQRGLGNKRCLPEGPLRESPQRLAGVDFVIVNGETEDLFRDDQYEMSLVSGQLKSLGRESAGSDLKVPPQSGESIYAVAGIGNPKRFFRHLEKSGYIVYGKAFSDHHHYVKTDFEALKEKPILMTEKDAVKCETIGLSNAWYLPVEAQLSNNFWEQFLTALKNRT